jgi:hypothetical protein
VGWNSHTRDRPADCLRSQTHLAAKIGCSWRSAKGPYQIISNSLGFIALHDILKCLSKEDCGVSKDIITVTEEGHLGKHHSTHPSPTLPPVEIQIAVRNLFVDREIASVEKTAARTRCLRTTYTTQPCRNCWAFTGGSKWRSRIEICRFIPNGAAL